MRNLWEKYITKYNQTVNIKLSITTSGKVYFLNKKKQNTIDIGMEQAHTNINSNTNVTIM